MRQARHGYGVNAAKGLVRSIAKKDATADTKRSATGLRTAPLKRTQNNLKGGYNTIKQDVKAKRKYRNGEKL